MLRSSRILVWASLLIASSACGADPEPGDSSLGGDSDSVDSDSGSDSDSGESDESDDTGETGQPLPPPFQEVYDQGLDDYLGTIEPAEMTEDGDATHYHFDVADGPSCLRGTPWHMSDRPGTDAGADLVLFLQGGGACWSDLCIAADEVVLGVPESGMLNRGLAGNPFAAMDVVFFPYCDGSVFAGDQSIDDDGNGEPDRIHHGLINLSAGLDVAKQAYPDPERVFLAGSSAGSYGVHFANMLVRKQWPAAEIVVIADAGLGLGRPGEPEFLNQVLGEWGAIDYFPPSCPSCADVHITGLVDWQLQQDPRMRFAALTAYQDAVIGGVFLGLGGADYSALVMSEIADLAALHPDRYDRFFFAGSLHTATSSDSFNPSQIASPFDTTTVEGVSAMQWLERLVTGDPSFDDLLQ